MAMNNSLFKSKTAKDIYNNWLIICEGYSLRWEIIREILILTKDYFKKIEKFGIAKHIEIMLLKEGEVDAGDWDNIRFLLHWEIDHTQPEPTDFLETIKRKYGSL